jgi:hypothetical protein
MRGRDSVPGQPGAARCGTAGNTVLNLRTSDSPARADIELQSDAASLIRRGCLTTVSVCQVIKTRRAKPR